MDAPDKMQVDRSGAVEEVEAEVLDGELMISSASFEIDMSGIQADIEDLTVAIDEALTVYGELLVAPEDIAAMPFDQARSCEREVNAVIRQANDLRLKLGRDYRLPLDMAKKRYDELMGPVEELRDAFKQRRIQIENERKDAKRRAIQDMYEAMAPNIALPAEGNDAALLPFDRVFALFGDKWLNKGCSLKAIEDELTGIVGRVLIGERRLDEANLKHPLEAKAIFWETLDAGAAIAHDGKLGELEERQAARDAERARTSQLLEAPPAAEQPAPEQPAAEPASIAAQALRKPRVMLIDGATDDECRQIGAFCKSLGISGVFKTERG